MQWITYQFMHAGFMHLLGNMLFLLVFSTVLELMYGGLLVGALYLVSGIAGAWGFLHWGQPTMAPMVGASGALTGLMAFYLMVERKKNVRFFYFLSPIEGYFGIIYLPTLLIIPLCLISDVTAFVASNTSVGGSIAYAAHLGGMLFGLIMGGLMRWTVQPEVEMPFAKDDDSAESEDEAHVA